DPKRATTGHEQYPTCSAFAPQQFLLDESKSARCRASAGSRRRLQRRRSPSARIERVDRYIVRAAGQEPRKISITHVEELAGLVERGRIGTVPGGKRMSRCQAQSTSARLNVEQQQLIVVNVDSRQPFSRRIGGHSCCQPAACARV